MRVLIIHNPAAGPRGARRELPHAIALLADRGWQVDLTHTRRPGDALLAARRAKHDVVVAAGGDGTLGEVAGGLAGRDIPMGVLPLGTGNVWARNVGLPVWSPSGRGALVAAAHVLLDGVERRVDLGCLGERCFLLHAGVGFDARAIQGIEPHRGILRGLRNLGYWVLMVGLGLSQRGCRTVVSVDGRTIVHQALMVLVTNVQFYAGPYCVAPAARLDDGLLDVHVLTGDGARDTFSHVHSALAGQPFAAPEVECLRGSEIAISCDSPQPVQMDGEPSSTTPVRISVRPGALHVIVPHDCPTGLFCRTG